MIDQYPSPNGVLTSLIWRKTAAGGETSLSGYDNASQALSYTPGQEQVYLNGILLVRGSDYTATNGTSITGLAALAADDFVQINCYNNFSVASVPATSLTGNILSTNLPSGSTSASGIVQLTDSTSSTSTTTAATPNSVKSAYDLANTANTTANGAIAKSTITTTGDIIYASGANTPARLGIGTTGQVISVSGGLPAWSTPSAGGMTLISTTNLSGSTTAEITGFSQDYVNLFLELNNITFNTSDTELRLWFGVFQNNVATGWATFNTTSTTSGSFSMDQIKFTAANNTNRTQPQSFVANIYNYTSTTRYTFDFRGGACPIGSTTYAAAGGAGIVNSTSNLTQITIGSAHGNTFSGGTVKLWGVK